MELSRFRKAFGAVALCAVMLATPAEAAEGRTYHLLILDSQAGNPYDEVRAALLETLAGRGYEVGRNLETVQRVTGNDAAEGERILRSEPLDHYDAVFVGGTVATIAAKNVLYGRPDVPVVFGAPTDPVGIGVIQDFKSPPAANFTGVCYPVPVKARLMFVRQLLPQAKKLGLIYADMPQSHSYNQWLRELLATDPAFSDLEIVFRPVPLITGENGDRAMAEAAVAEIRALDPEVDAFIKPNDQLGTRRALAEAVYEHASKPLIGLVKDDVMGSWGATAVVYPSHASIGEQAAAMLVELFQGKPVARIVPEWPRKYGYAVDLPKARRFGIKVPIGILQLAGENIVK